MEPHNLPENTLQLITSNDEYLHTHIPWWQDLGAEARAELRLEPLEEAERRGMVDVVVIGGGVADLCAALSGSEAGADGLFLFGSQGLCRGAPVRNAGIFASGCS